jgi:hypothetical protein
MGSKNGVSSIFGPIITLFNYFNESKIELTPFFENRADPIFHNNNLCQGVKDEWDFWSGF